jgi:ATP-dependent DNA helicase RecG
MLASAKSPAEQLATPVQFLRGVGPQRAELLQRLDLYTARDVLFFFPRTYQDMTDLRDADQLEDDKLQSVCGVVEEFEIRGGQAGRCVLGVLVRSASGHLRGLWFNQPFMQEKFKVGQRVVFSGKPKQHGLVWEMSHPKVDFLGDESDVPMGRIVPVYPLTEGLQQWQIRKIVAEVVDTFANLLEEIFPEDYLHAHNLWPLPRAIRQMHVPENAEQLAGARRRLAYQELFLLGLALALKRHQQRDLRQAPSLEATAQIDARIRRLFPFELTAGQQQAIADIRADMAQSRPMNRLLQGDVGSGKTVVALYAMLLAVAHGHQAVLMAPTEILARQHALTLRRLLAQSQVRRVEMIGGLSSNVRTAMLEEIAAGRIDLVVGTHAVLQEDVRFAKLGLVVIDEQHRFGVRQRAALKATTRTESEQGMGPNSESVVSRPLKQSGSDPHYLVMTATPIPRTVTMTLFGDLDVSVLSELPPGRQKVHTYLAGDDRRERWWAFVRKKLDEGRQAYVVVPLVEESEQLTAVSVQETYEALANGELEAYRLGLIHGRMTSEEKDAAMERFRRGETQVLVATSLVEVGVDVPNATLMTIENGERFGLSQLHQLRGRIGRGKHPGFCCVFAAPQSEGAQERLKALESTADGFELAEIDFRLRGPGDLFGTRQHGLPPLRVADLQSDAGLLAEARRNAADLLIADPGLSQPPHAALRQRMLARYGKALDLGDVG